MRFIKEMGPKNIERVARSYLAEKTRWSQKIFSGMYSEPEIKPVKSGKGIILRYTSPISHKSADYAAVWQFDDEKTVRIGYLPNSIKKKVDDGTFVQPEDIYVTEEVYRTNRLGNILRRKKRKEAFQTLFDVRYVKTKK